MKGLFNGYVIGNACRSVELRNWQGGQVGSTTIAVNDGKKENSVTQYVKATFWGKAASVAGQFIQKGSPVFCSGRLTQETYTDKNGVERTNVCMSVENFQLLSFGGSGIHSNNNNQQTDYSPRQVEQVKQFGNEPQDANLSDDIPF